jgi:Skp family chaperone for outer membrane proteins
MRTASALFLGAALAGIALFTGAVMAERPEPVAGPVVFVDLDRVFQECAEGKRLVDQLKANAEILDNGLTKRAEALQTAINDLRGNVQPDTPKFKEQWRLLEQEKWSLDYDDREGRASLNAQRVDGMLALHKRVVVACEQLVEAKGYSAVMQYSGEGISPRAPNGEALSINELSLQVATRPVVAVHPGNDITDAVIELLQ